MNKRMLVMIGIGAGLVLAATAGAQVQGESTAGLQFNFGLPGARSLGMGGAFLGLADDATAAQQNPAGLINLSQPEVALEIRRFDYRNAFTDRGYSGPSNASTPPAGFPRELVLGESSDSVSSLSFASFVLAKPKWALSFYRHQLVDYEASFSTFGAVLGVAGTCPGGICTDRLYPIDTRTDVSVDSYGSSLGWRIGENFSLGAGAAFHRYNVTASTVRHNVGASDFSDPIPGSEVTREAVSGDDHDVTLNAGFLWKSSGDKVSLGGSYRQGPEFTGDYHAVVHQNGAADLLAAKKAPFKVPDAYGLGVAFKPVPALTVAFDVVRIQYGDLARSLAVPAFLTAGRGQFVLDDGTELRLGMEYRFTNLAVPLRLRAGSWRDPAHQIRYRSRGLDPLASQEGAEDAEATVVFASGERAKDEMHYTSGLGLIFRDGNFIVDLGADFSKRVDTLSMSGVVRW